jgi:hypothetical protein
MMPQAKKQSKKNDSHRKQIRFGELLIEINEARKNEALGSWVKQACRDRIKREKK